MRKILDLETLCEMDNGRIRAAFNHELEAVVNDCYNRPGDSTARKIALVIEIKPKDFNSGLCETVTTSMAVKSSIPARKKTGMVMKITDERHVIFNDESFDDPNQRTLDEIKVEKSGQ